MIRRSIFSTNTQSSASLIYPVAVAGADQELGTGVTTTTLDGSSSYDLDGTITTYAWTEISAHGAGITSPAASSTGITGLSDGNTYTFRLTVTDNDGQSHSNDIDVYVDTPSSAELTITTSIPTPLYTGTLDIVNGEPYEIIYLSFELFDTADGCNLDFSGANTGSLDHLHPTRTGSVTLDSNGEVTKNYSTISAPPQSFSCLVSITSRSSAEPVPLSNTTYTTITI
jgi:hypothetical protein